MDVQPRTPTLAQVIPCAKSKGYVESVAIHGNQLFVGRYNAQVEVYETTAFSLQR